MTHFRKPPQMSTRPCTFVIRPDPPDTAVTHEELQALACQLGLVDHDGVHVRIVGNELRLTLTPVAEKVVREGSRR